MTRLALGLTMTGLIALFTTETAQAHDGPQPGGRQRIVYEPESLTPTPPVIQQVSHRFGRSPYHRGGRGHVHGGRGFHGGRGYHRGHRHHGGRGFHGGRGRHGFHRGHGFHGVPVHPGVPLGFPVRPGIAIESRNFSLWIGR